MRIPADDERLLAKLGILEFLDGSEESVQVEVRENLLRGKATVASCSSPQHCRRLR